MRAILFIPILFATKCLFAQGAIPNALALPSSNNSFLAKSFGGNSDVSVDLYTGTAMVHTSICAIPGKELNIPISLDYVDGRGVKLNEYASQVGLGFQLNAGGSITRVVRSFPDELPNGYLGTGTLPAGAIGTGGQWGKVVANDLNGNNVPFTAAQYIAITGLNKTTLAYTNPTADGEPDIFFVKTPFFNFQFVFDENGNPVFSNTNGYKIISNNFYNTPSPTNQSSWFEVIDPTGNQFYFGNTSNSSEQSTDSLYGVPTTFVSAWYLTKIITFNSKDIITFNYTTNPNTAINDITYSYSWSQIVNQLGQTQTTLGTGKNIVIK